MPDWSRANVRSVRRDMNTGFVKRPPRGKPIGSTNGRQPIGGYPPVSFALGSFLAGFLEGEASFGIVRQTGRTNFKCLMSLGARDDDKALIEELAASTGLGTVTAKPAQAGARSQVAWRIIAKADCARLVEILDQYPLRGRKSLDYAIWRGGVCWWVGDDPTRTYPNRDKTPIAYLKQRLHEVKSFSQREVGRVIRDDCHGLARDWPGYISGLVTAEGSLGIVGNAPGSLVPKLQLRMRADDRPLLRELVNRMDAGKLYKQRPSRSYPPGVVSWIVCGRDDLCSLVETFDDHPLRGRKRREYDCWREAVLEYAKGQPPRARYARMRELRDALAHARAYRSPTGTQLS